MKNIEVRERFTEAYNEIVHDAWILSRNYGSPTFDDRVRERGKYESCGQTLYVPRLGREVRHYCRRPACPACSTFWGRSLGQKLVARYLDIPNDDFRMITMILGVTDHLDGAFNQFKSSRKAMSNAIGYQRNRGLDRTGWRDFGIAGALEIDHFLADEFDEIGSQKRRQYRDLGYDPNTAKGSQWVVTVHGIVHVGRLGEDTIRTGLRSVAPIIHLDKLFDSQALDEAAKGIVGYAGKVAIETSLINGQSREWPMEALKEYLLAVKRNSHGRQGFRVLVNPKSDTRSKKKSTSSRAIGHDNGNDCDAMPVVIL